MIAFLEDTKACYKPFDPGLFFTSSLSAPPALMYKQPLRPLFVQPLLLYTTTLSPRISHVIDTRDRSLLPDPRSI